MLLTVSIPPLRPVRGRIDDVACLASEADVEDLAPCLPILQAVSFAGGSLETKLLAFGCVPVFFYTPVLALVPGGDGVGVPAAFHSGGGDWTVDC